MTYIDPRGKVFAHLDRLVGWRAGEKPAAVTVEWDLSNRCVLACQDCHFAHTHVKGPWKVRPRVLPMAFDSTGDIADMNLVLRALGQAKDHGVRSVIWSGGGEPTTHPDWWVAVDYAATIGLRQGMYTLGGLLGSSSRHPSAKWLADRSDWVVVSLDAPDGPTYAAEKGVPPERFEAACKGIRWLVEAGSCVVGVSFLLHECNWFRADEMLTLARELGATYTTFRPAIQTSPANPGMCSVDRSWVTAAMPTLQRLSAEPDVEIDPDRFAQYRDWQGHGYATCYGVRLNTTITPDGRVWLCPQRRGIAGSCLGDLRTESFAEIWARHPGHYSVDEGCRVMCRLHAVNETLSAIEQPRLHEAFV